MRTLLIGIAALAFLAAPAMAMETTTVNVNLTIESYVRLQNVPTDITITLANGANTGTGAIRYEVVSNVTRPLGWSLVTASITPAGTVGTWSVDEHSHIDTTCVQMEGSGIYGRENTVTVADVGAAQAAQEAILGATVTLTVAVP